jgi:hypothetical protein
MPDDDGLNGSAKLINKQYVLNQLAGAFFDIDLQLIWPMPDS